MKILGWFFCLFGAFWILTIFCPIYRNPWIVGQPWMLALILGCTSLLIGVSLIKGWLQ